MKIIISILMAFTGITAFANCRVTQNENSEVKTKIIGTDVPKHLKGAVIIIKTADGKEVVMNSDLFKVVPRKRQEIVVEITKTVNQVCSLDQQPPLKNEKETKNTLSVLGGGGFISGLDVFKSGNLITVENRVGLVGGLMYQRKIDDISIGAQLQTNKSVLGSIGINF